MENYSKIEALIIDDETDICYLLSNILKNRNVSSKIAGTLEEAEHLLQKQPVPKIIFLDEPTTGLDPQARRSLWELIRQIRDKGTTVIITTHYMDEAEYLCDRIAIIDAGRIVALDSPDQLIDNLVAKGFERPKEMKMANLEDVFIDLTGHSLREE